MSELEEVILRDGNSLVAIVPQRGAIVTRFEVGDRRVLFLDGETLRDPAKNVRGGVPVLFPTPGKLANDSWSYANKTGTQKQHGFARNVAWRVTERGAATAVLSIESNDETRAQYPWDFTFDMAFSVSGPTLRLEQRIANKSASPMPCGVGFHPYFQIADRDKGEATITTLARRAFDNVTKQTIELRGPIDLTQKEVDLHLLDHGSTESELRGPNGGVKLRGSAEYTHWVVWTLAGRDFVCLEPWTCPGNALNTGERLLVLAPGETRTLWLDVTWQPS